jgi:hydantoinase/carbamoylase family amidase
MGTAGVTATEAAIVPNRLICRLEALGRIGRDPRGGVTRLSFTDEHAAACRLLAEWMRDAGLEPRLDDAGNMFGVPGAVHRGVAMLLAGSHIDSVPMGGTLDGALGIVAAIEAAQTLHDAGICLVHPLVVAAFADEEGNSFGIGCLTSRAVVDELAPGMRARIRDRSGRTLAERLSAWSCDLPREAAPTTRAYLELHIEQGPRLDVAGLDAAAVTSIVGISRTTATFTGTANHAGTTPMESRRDALWGASAFVLALRQLALDSAGGLVATAGRVDVLPGATNVIPGEARVRVELRAPDQQALDAACDAAASAAAEAASRHEVTVRLDPWDTMPAAALDLGLVEIALAAAAQRGLRAVRMPSWAGHDAKILAPHVPAALLFVPSRNGVSHAPEEYTEPRHLVAGAQLLLDTIRAADSYLATREGGRS